MPAAAGAATSHLIRGTAVCRINHTITGVYVSAWRTSRRSSQGGSRFAIINKYAGAKNAALYRATISTTTGSTSVRLEVGCGGSTASWWSNRRSAYLSVGASRTINTRCSEAAGTAQRCTWPPAGQTVSSNRATAGNCTWGALEQWHSRHSSYVSSVPHRRSIVVFEAGTSGSGAQGHVAYVTNVTALGSGVFDIDVVEMNAFHGGGGFNRYNSWTYRPRPGQMRYVVGTN